MKTNDRVRGRVAADLAGGEEIRAIVHLQRVAAEGRPSSSGTISATHGGGELEAAMLERRGFDPGPVVGHGEHERRDLVGSWLTLTDDRLYFHGPDTGFWVVKARPGELRATIDRRELVGVDHADHTMTAMIWRTWLLRFEDGTWLLGHSPIGGRVRKNRFDDEADLAVEAFGPKASLFSP